MTQYRLSCISVGALLFSSIRLLTGNLGALTAADGTAPVRAARERNSLPARLTTPRFPSQSGNHKKP